MERLSTNQETTEQVAEGVLLDAVERIRFLRLGGDPSQLSAQEQDWQKQAADQLREKAQLYIKLYPSLTEDEIARIHTYAKNKNRLSMDSVTVEILKMRNGLDKAGRPITNKAVYLASDIHMMIDMDWELPTPDQESPTAA